MNCFEYYFTSRFVKIVYTSRYYINPLEKLRWNRTSPNDSDNICTYIYVILSIILFIYLFCFFYITPPANSRYTFLRSLRPPRSSCPHTRNSVTSHNPRTHPLTAHSREPTLTYAYTLTGTRARASGKASARARPSNTYAAGGSETVSMRRLRRCSLLLSPRIALSPRRFAAKHSARTLLHAVSGRRVIFTRCHHRRSRVPV